MVDTHIEKSIQDIDTVKTDWPRHLIKNGPSFCSRLVLLLAGLLLYGNMSVAAATVELYKACLDNRGSAAIGSCQAYIDAGGTSIGAYTRLGNLYKEKEDFERAKSVFEQALKIKETSSLSVKIKTSNSLIEEQGWIESQKNVVSDQKVVARTDRMLCIRFSRFKPKMAYDACTRLMEANPDSEVDQEVVKAFLLAKESLGLSSTQGGEGLESTEKTTKSTSVAAGQKSDTTGAQKNQSDKAVTNETNLVDIAAPDFSKETVMQLQSLLNNLGYRPGSSNGISGSQTEAAIRSFERDYGLTVSGKPKAYLLVLLRQEVKARQKPAAIVSTKSPQDSTTSFATNQRLPDPNDRANEEEIQQLRKQIAELNQLIETSPRAAVQAYLERGKRKALVIGNWDYPDSLGRLRNPGKDAKLISRTLITLNFQVITILNGNKRDMELGIRNFYRSIEPEDTALFYYAGHGVQIQGENHLIPVGEDFEDVIDIKYKSVNLSYVMEKMNRQNTGLSIVILDACRNNPYTNEQGVQKGWASLKGPVGTLVAYATAPGEVAMDGVGENGLYTKYLVRMMKQPGLRIEDVFKKVRVAVEKESNGVQIPWENSSMTGDFFFVNPNSS